MISPTYGLVTYEQLVGIIAKFILAHGKDRQYELCIGTDSQNFSMTKIVLVITLHDVGHGGIFFYETTYVRKIESVREKLTYETTKSLLCAQEFFNAADQFKKVFGFDILKYVSFCIHVDAGPNGKSREVMNELCGWVQACGYEVKTKPESYAASGVANKISK